MSNTKLVEEPVFKDVRRWMDEPVFSAFPEERMFTRADFIHLGVGNLLAAARLSNKLRELGIGSSEQLCAVGLTDLMSVDGIGERAAFVAAVLLDTLGFDVAAWLKMPAGSWERAIREAKKKAAKRKRRH